MELDQSYPSAVDWNFPSPTATPPTNTYVHNQMQTPKTIPFPTHFQDAYNTPQVGIHATPQQHSYQTTTPGPQPHASTEGLQNHYYGNMEGNTMLPGKVHRMQMGQQGHVQDMPQGHIPIHHNPSNMSSFSDGSQMQTPPPTRGSTAKKQYTHASRLSFGTPSTIASRRIVTPQNLSQISQQRPVLPLQHPNMAFTQLQIPSEGLNYANFGPASAPVMPQSHNPWDQPMNSARIQPPGSLDDPFAPITTSASQWPVLPFQGHNDPSMFDTPAMRGFPVQPPDSRPATTLPFTTAFTAENGYVTVNGSVDPSLVYSSPARPLIRSSSFRTKVRQETGSALKRKDSSTSLRSDMISANEDDETHPTGPGLRRSQTLGSLRSKSNALIASMELSNRSNSIKEPPRTVSPLKRNGKPSLSSIFEDKPQAKPAIVLTIDENGRARTEARNASESSPTRRMRARYPGLYDSESSDDEDDDSDQSEPAASRAASLSLMRSDDRKSKAARLDPPVENMEGLSILRSASAASLRKPVAPSRAALAAAAQLRRNGSLRRIGSVRNLRRRRSVLANGSGVLEPGPLSLSSDAVSHSFLQPHSGPPDMISPASTDSDSQISWLGDHAAPFDQTLAPAVNLSVHNNHAPVQDPQWQGLSFDQPATSFQAWSFQAPGPAEIMHNQALIRPPPQPMSSGIMMAADQQNPLVQCLCGVSGDTTQPLVQCRVCASWHHSFCVGPNVPANFTCAFCIRPPSNMMVQAPIGWA